MIQAAQLIVSLSILVILHELGHFIPAKLFKTKVEKFYLFFNPWFSLFKKKIGNTVYGIGWLPLGGYVKIAGMIDESMDKEQMKKDPEPWEFRAKPAWQRLIIMVGGVTVNVILGIFIYAMMLFTWGSEYIPTENMNMGIYADSLGQEIGFQNGDKILAVDGEHVEKFNDVPLKIIIDEANTVTVLRAGERKTFEVPKGTVAKLIEHRKSFISPAYAPVVDSVMSGQPAEKAGLKKEDRILAVDGTETPYFQDVVKALQSKKDETVELQVLRDGEKISLETVEVTEKGTLGFGIVPPEKQIKTKVEEYSFFESFPAGVEKGYKTFDNYIGQMALIFKPETGAYKSLGGFITIGQQFGSVWDWQRFWAFTAFLSIVLAIMNILPIPALDGGHVMFLLYEIFSGRKPNEKVMEYAQIVGMLILFALLLLANGNDIMRLFD